MDKKGIERNAKGLGEEEGEMGIDSSKDSATSLREIQADPQRSVAGRESSASRVALYRSLVDGG